MTNEADGTTVSVATGVGNIAYEFLVNGKNAYWFPYESAAEFAAAPQFCGNPFLAPLANRLDENGYYANGAKYLLNPGFGNFERDPERPADSWLVGLLSGLGSCRFAGGRQLGLGDERAAVRRVSLP